MAFSTLYEFCRNYGPERFAELVKLLNDPDETHASIAKRFGVTASCVTRWAGKFCETHVILRADVLAFLESHYDIQMDVIKQAQSIIEGQRNELRFIQGGRGRADEEAAESS
jgi:hypothetical protein